MAKENKYYILFNTVKQVQTKIIEKYGDAIYSIAGTYNDGDYKIRRYRNKYCERVSKTEFENDFIPINTFKGIIKEKDYDNGMLKKDFDKEIKKLTKAGGTNQTYVSGDYCIIYKFEERHSTEYPYVCIYNYRKLSGSQLLRRVKEIEDSFLRNKDIYVFRKELANILSNRREMLLEGKTSDGLLFTDVPTMLQKKFSEKINTIRYDNDNHSLHITTNNLQGTFETNEKIKFDLGTFDIDIFLKKENSPDIHVRRYLPKDVTKYDVDDRPYVSTCIKGEIVDNGNVIHSRRICYGSSANDITDAWERCDLLTIASMTLELLDQPSHESDEPYTTWYNIFRSNYPGIKVCTYCRLPDNHCTCKDCHCGKDGPAYKTHKTGNLCDNCNFCPEMCTCWSNRTHLLVYKENKLKQDKGENITIHIRNYTGNYRIDMVVEKDLKEKVMKEKEIIEKEYYKRKEYLNANVLSDLLISKIYGNSKEEEEILQKREQEEARLLQQEGYI